MYKFRKVIVVRYLNKSEEHPMSRPHKIQKITKDDNTIHYYTMNKSREVDPTTFTTSWEKKTTSSKVTVKQIAVWEYIRVKFVREDGTFSRPKKIYKITENNTVVSYAPVGVKGTARRIDPSEFITEWEHAGKTPTPKPLRKYCDESLKQMGYTIEEIRGIRSRNFSAKDVKIVSHKLHVSNAKARELLVKSNGKRYEN